ncbi:19584_t:CDS:2, partial [Racocetra fulgida]
MLLNQYSEQYGINLDICRISEDIYECTNGHKGLYSSTRLIKFIKELRAYKSIVRVIKSLSSKQTDIISIVLCYGTYTYECNNEDGEIYRLLAEGIVVSKSVNEDYIEMEFSSPILRSIILSMISGPDIDITNPPQTINKIDINWLLENTIENLAVQNIFAPQALNADNNPSEYAFQAEFSAVLKYLLSNVYPVLQYRVIVEAKERDINGNRRKR